MSKRKSIYIGDALQRLLEAHVGDESGFRSTSGIINAVADRYSEVVRRSMPRFTVNEWCLIWDALNGVWMQEPASLAVSGVPLNVSDSIQLNRYDKKWEVDGDALMRKISDLPFCGLLAIVDAAERFWARDDWPQDHAEMVSAVVGDGAVEV